MVRVIVDVRPDGTEEWAEQGPDEIRWYPHEPLANERAMLRRWRTTGRPPCRGQFLAVLK